jgi:hypothetical protein
MKSTHQTVAHGINAGAGVPIRDELPELGTLRMIVYCLRVEQLRQKAAPASQEQGPIVELDTEHVRRRGRPWQREQVVADLPGSGSHVVVRADRSVDSADRGELGQVVSGTRIRCPDAADLRVYDARMRLGCRP